MSDTGYQPTVHKAIRIAFGAISGVTMGGLAGAACCLVVGYFDFFEACVLAAVVVGVLVGLIWESVRHTAEDGTAATINFSKLGVAFGLIPTVCLTLAIVTRTVGKLGILLTPVGWVTGMLLGAILDRAYQDAGNRKWLTTIAAVAVHVAITCCLVTLVDAMCNYGPEPGEVCRKLSWQIVAKMNGENQQADFLVDDIQLTRTGRRSYSGFVDVTRHDEQERLSLRVTAKPFGLLWELGPNFEATQ